MTNKNYVPENIREKLRQYDHIEEKTCLECGYQGLMGLKEQHIHWYATIWAKLAILIILLGLISRHNFRFMFIVMFIVAYFLGNMDECEYTYVCPNCDEEIHETE